MPCSILSVCFWDNWINLVKDHSCLRRSIFFSSSQALNQAIKMSVAIASIFTPIYEFSKIFFKTFSYSIFPSILLPNFVFPEVLLSLCLHINILRQLRSNYKTHCFKIMKQERPATTSISPTRIIWVMLEGLVKKLIFMQKKVSTWENDHWSLSFVGTALSHTDADALMHSIATRWF